VFLILCVLGLVAFMFKYILTNSEFVFHLYVHLQNYNRYDYICCAYFDLKTELYFVLQRVYHNSGVIITALNNSIP
jgi:hypothetical protein